MSLPKNFTIQNTLIDFGAEGKFGPGSEARLRDFLSGKKDGAKTFDRLVSRGAITVDSPEAEEEPKQPAKKKEPKKSEEESKKEEAEDSTDAGEESESDEESDEEDKEPEYEGTGQREINHYGGGNFELIDPEGHVVDTAGNKKDALAWQKEGNETK